MAGEILDTRSLVGQEPVVSHTQNAEDVRLYRVFRDLEDGFYVDIGAGNATAGSVTRLFYDRGWSGINVEPGPEFQSLVRDRPRDVNIEAAIGESDGQVSFFVTYPDPSLSTLDLEAHRDVMHAFERHERVSVRQCRLDSILREHAAGRSIQFLKVDVEGAERQVLASCDWQECRPIVVLVEAVESWSTAPTHESWEDILVGAGYEFAVFDGVNRFYVDAAHRDLIPALAYPVSALDRYTPAGLGETQTLVRELLTENERLRADAARLREEVRALYGSRTWRVGALAARAAGPMLAVRRRLRRPRERAPASPPDAYRSAVREGRPWHFPSAVDRSRSQRTRLRPLLRELGPLDCPLDVQRAERIERLVRELDWTDGASLLERRFTAEERQAIVEVDAVSRVVRARAASSAGRYAGNVPRRPVVVADARCLQDPNYRHRGVGAHARSVLRATHEATRGLDLLLLQSPDLPPPAPEDLALANGVIWAPELRHLDVVLFVQLSPMTASSASAAVFLTTSDCRTAAVVYDFIPGEYPAAYLRRDGDRLSYRARTESLRNYDLLLAISDATAGACRRLLGPDARAVSTGVANPLVDVEAGALTRSRPFALVPSGPDPRKNTPAALAALAEHATRGGDALDVVVTGDLTGRLGDALHDLERSLGLGEMSVDLVGTVEPRLLAALYDRAEVVVVPSHSEGFSLPLVEAAARGTPVVASDIAPHRELVGAGPWLAPADDVVALADAIDHVRLHRAAVAAKQSDAVRELSDPTGIRRRVVDGLRELLVDREIESPAPHRAPRRSSLAVVTPFPPQASGVADYTAYTFREIAKHVDVDVFGGGRARGPDAASGLSVHAVSTEPYLDGRYDRVVTVLGNSHFHYPMLDLLGAYGGACIAHDVSMASAHGFDRGTWAEADDAGYGLIAKTASPLIVHGRAFARKLEAEAGVRPTVVPFVPYNLPREGELGAAARAHARSRLGLADDCSHVATFGFVDLATKGHDLLLGALAWLRRWNLRVELHVVGDAPQGERRALERVADELEVADVVTFHGRVSPERLHAFLSAVDSAVQIRLSPDLTLSGALADCIAFGLPTVTTSGLAEELEAPPFVVTVEPSTSSLVLAEEIERALGVRRSGGAEVEDERRAYLESRSVAGYARGLLAALELEASR